LPTKKNRAYIRAPTRLGHVLRPFLDGPTKKNRAYIRAPTRLGHVLRPFLDGPTKKNRACIRAPMLGPALTLMCSLLLYLDSLGSCRHCIASSTLSRL
jgi:peptide methionine sulfoxide reductase MsrB